MRSTIWLSATLLVALCTLSVSAAPERTERKFGTDKFIAHEWGTFTSLQDEDGKELAGINIDDEPVPGFVHNLNPFVLSPTFLTRNWFYRHKGVPQGHPHVTMRLETPVIYFYRPAGMDKPVTVDVDVKFRGGWLTEFYPDAEASAPGLRSRRFQFGDLTPATVGGLTWNNLKVGTDAHGPRTEEHVWVTPRLVDSDHVTTSKGESEEYLFYRGVAHQRAPLRVSTDSRTGQLTIRANFREVYTRPETRVRDAWLVDVQPGGRIAYRSIPSFVVTTDEEKVASTVGGEFQPKDYRPGNMVKLFEEMHASLVEDGLYRDEATAMLATWNRAYFASPGRRLFFVVPRAWTDHYLPLKISKVDSIERVMMGRIELVTPDLRRLLRKIADGPVPDAAWVDKIPRSEARERFLAGRVDFGKLGVEIPPDYRTYLQLGRFRNALIIDEERRRPTSALTKFVDAYGLQGYRWKEKRRPADD